MVDTTTQTPVALSVVIPLYNEADTFQKLIDRLAVALRGFNEPWEAILVNDGSSDATWDRALQLAGRSGYEWLRVIGYENHRGRGRALREGFAAARGELICTIEPEAAANPEVIVAMAGALRGRKGLDLVLASIYMPGGKTPGLPFRAFATNRLRNLLLGWLISPAGKKIHTVTAIARMYRRHVLDSIDLESDGPDINLEILSKAMMLGYSYAEIPAVLKNPVVRGAGGERAAVSNIVWAVFERPVVAMTMVGIVLLIVACAILSLFYVQSRLGSPIKTNRPLMVVITIFFIASIQLIGFGILAIQFMNLRKEIVRLQAQLRRTPFSCHPEE